MIGVARKATIKSRESNFFAQRTQQTARAFHQHHIKTLLHRANVRENL